MAKTHVGFYGLDLDSLQASADAIIRYLDQIDPAAARRARERHACFERFGGEMQPYGYATAVGMAGVRGPGRRAAPGAPGARSSRSPAFGAFGLFSALLPAARRSRLRRCCTSSSTSSSPRAMPTVASAVHRIPLIGGFVLMMTLDSVLG